MIEWLSEFTNKQWWAVSGLGLVLLSSGFLIQAIINFQNSTPN